MRHVSILISAIFLSSYFGLPLQAAETPVKIGHQLSCTGEIDGYSDSLHVILQNSDSFRTSESTAAPTQITTYLKSHIQGGRWFAIVPSSGQGPGQLFWIYQHTGNTRKLLAYGGYGAKMVLSSTRPRLEIVVDPRLKFDLFLEAGEANLVKISGYLALRAPNAPEPIVAQDLNCQIEPSVKQ